MDHQNITQPSIPSAAAGMDFSEELLAEVDEPPDERRGHISWAPPNLQPHASFMKADPAIFHRRESLLTRQLHSENEQTDEEDSSRAPPRTLSAQSTWSIPSVASTAELTSDDGHSVASAAISPPLPPTTIATAIPISEKPLTKEPTILGQEDKLAETGSEKSVEAGLGRKRCISFACGGSKDKRPPPTSTPKETSKPVDPAPVAANAPISPPKRKCMLKFVCPTRNSTPAQPPLQRTASARRFASPPPPERRPTKAETKAHRGSDSTVTHASPKSIRKSPVIVTTAPTPTATTAGRVTIRKESNDDSDGGTEATRFHEFASSDDEPEEWVQESGCYRSRLTVTDTLKKENILRRACEEVEEEAVEEEESEELAEDEADADADEDVDADEDDVDDDLEEEDESDDGFRTDDEEGFAASDSEGEDSDEDWWRPGGASTAATSIDHLDLLAQAKLNTTAPASSVGSASSSHISPRTLLRKPRRKSQANAMPIAATQSQPVDLPDSTDFVCGTLDEDRPLEQAFINHKKQREAAKHKARPQDIDPTFPTSDPDMDEDDDEDLEQPEESDHESLMHGTFEDLHGDNTVRRRPSHRGRSGSNVQRSPPPPARRRSPAPGALKRLAMGRSPQPPARHRSPAPVVKRTSTVRSPPPPPVRRTTARSPPPPRKLFGDASSRTSSPANGNKMTSPPQTRRPSPTVFADYATASANILASRPDITRTASLPRGGGFHLGKLNGFRLRDHEDSDTAGHAQACDTHKRGAIDIYKGLEKKRQRRKEKLHQKMCAKAAAKGEKNYRVKPGKGAERMREIGLEIQRYRGKGEHILSM